MLFHGWRLVGPEWVGWQGVKALGVEGGPLRPMSEPNVPSRRSRLAVIALGVAALSLALPMSARADENHHGKRHGNHSRGYYQSEDGNYQGGDGYYENDHGYYGPPPVYYGGPRPCRGPKHVRVYNNYYPVAVPVAVPVYAYPAYPSYPPRYRSGNGVVHIGVDWDIDF